MLLSCGDALIDFLPVRSADGRDALVPIVGGSCLNVTVGIARHGAPADFVGGISTDLFGRMIAEHADKSQVDLRYGVRSSRPTTLAFVRAVDGEPHYAFYDEGTASRHWTCRSGAIPVCRDPRDTLGIYDARRRQSGRSDAGNGRGRTRIDYRLVRSELPTKSDRRQGRVCPPYGSFRGARRHRAPIGQRLRLPLWRRRPRREGGGSPCCSFVITRGVEGARAWHRQAGAIEVRAPRVDVVDTIGAGDRFQAGLLFTLRAMCWRGAARRHVRRSAQSGIGLRDGMRGLHLRASRC